MSPKINQESDEVSRSLLVWRTDRGVVGEVQTTPDSEPLRLRLRLSL